MLDMNSVYCCRIGFPLRPDLTLYPTPLPHRTRSFSLLLIFFFHARALSFLVSRLSLRSIASLQFDRTKIVSGSADHNVKINSFQ